MIKKKSNLKKKYYNKIMKLSIVSKTFRIHDNPFLDSDFYIIYIDENEYGHHQKKFLDTILPLHIKDLENIRT